jgi:hypothetical protein
MALTEAGLDAAAIERDFAGKGIKRRRQVLVARQAGKPVLAAICESGGEGMNIFGLMNLCWTVPLTDDPVSPAIYGPLVRAVRAHYQAHGVSDFLFLEREPSLADDLVRTGLSLVSPGIRWLARVEVLPAWLGYVENELAAIR